MGKRERERERESENQVPLNYQQDLIIIIIIIIIIHSLKLFTSALADGFSLEFERQQVSSSLQDSSYYSGRSQ